ncbi:hypothetical protein [Actinoplanes sp. NPDC049118]|uniref:hypothetical protein n=1 Tax=Actinoplanes sp. NPDC049118 TaxID=3155769 RepID=UPI0033F0DCE5
MLGITRRRRFPALAAGLLLVAAHLGVQAIGAAPAAAATIPPGSIVVVTASSGFSVSAAKTVTAQCPATNPRVLGGGFTTSGRHIEVVERRPMSGLTDSFRAVAVQDEIGTTATWQLMAYAYCSSVAPGWELLTAVSTTTSNAFNAIYPSCPNGKLTTGGGGQINGGGGQVKLLTQGVGGTLNPRGYGVAGLEDSTGFSGNWSVTAYLICVTTGAFGDFAMAENRTASDTTVSKSVSVGCPTGKRVAGSAAWTDSRGTITAIRPNNTTPTIVTATGRDETATPGTGGWSLIVTAFCVS